MNYTTIIMFDFEDLQPAIMTVKALNSYLRELLETDEVLRDIWVKGEISNFTRASSGHLYFTLKDADAQVKCVMWKGSTFGLRFDPREGMAVEVHGSMSIYSATGQVQLYVSEMRQAGQGQLYAEFLKLKAKLQVAGLFDKKKPLPRFPHHIGIVSSATGAALQDMLHALDRRLPTARVTIAPSTVQGADAPASIIRALNALNRIEDLDVILLGRGGGSIEDLWCFNDEALAYVIFNSRVPVISGVGHETDFTIADFVADLRAPTPTAAAELASPVTVDDLLQNLTDRSARLEQSLSAIFTMHQQKFQLAQSALERVSPRQRIYNTLQRQDELFARLDRAMTAQLQNLELRLEKESAHLKALSPMAVLARGYAIISDPSTGKVVKHIAQIEPTLPIRVQILDGTFYAEVTDIKRENNYDEN
ncbi:MAG TPA: exodeoxyribonuclease VII large subunit [Anaerolineaceae bacterium]|nr:exodeoxyribonuclease VII large subunit [Anaerolineaceae bacterium]